MIGPLDILWVDPKIVGICRFDRAICNFAKFIRGPKMTSEKQFQC